MGGLAKKVLPPAAKDEEDLHKLFSDLNIQLVTLSAGW